MEPGEGGVCDAAVRETREEVGGLTPLGLRWRGGLLEFWNWESGGSVESVHFVHLFTASGFEGAPPRRAMRRGQLGLS